MDWRKFLPQLNRSFITKALILALVYLASAKIGLSLAHQTEQVSLIWPASGIALASLLLLGFRYWPAIFVGALGANLLTHEPWLVALSIALGNTLEALVGVYLLRLVRFKTTLSAIRDVLALIVLAACLSTLVSATIGTLSLALGGLTPWNQLSTVWTDWWVGDMMSDLIFAPIILLAVETIYWRDLSKQVLEVALMLALTLAASVVVFAQSDINSLRIGTYLVFPFIIWIALRSSQLACALAVAIISFSSYWWTVQGFGPFRNYGSVDQNLLTLQPFLFTVAVTAFIMGAAVFQRRIAERALRAKTAELEDSQAQLVYQLHQKQELERELKDANARITNIVTGMLDDGSDGYGTYRNLNRQKKD